MTGFDESNHVHDESEHLLSHATSSSSKIDDRSIVTMNHGAEEEDDFLQLDKSFDQPVGSTVIQSFFAMAKTSIGAGSFALPWAISQSGLFLGAIGLFLVSIVSLYTMKLMIQTKKLVNLRRSHYSKAESYPEIAEIVAPGWGPLLVKLCVIVTCTGVSAGYLIFIGLNLRSALLHLAGFNLTLLEVYAFILPIVVLLTFLPSFKALSKVAYAGSIFLVFAMLFTVVSESKNGVFFNLHDLYLWKFDTFPLFFGIAAFLFGVHPMVMPLEQGMKNPERINTVLNSSCAVVLGVNLPFAVFGYIAFGNGADGYIFCNLPRNTLLHLVQLALSLELMLSIPIVLLPGPLVIEEWLSIPQHPETTEDSLKQKGVRAGLVLGAWAFAIAVPIFEDILSLVGGLSCATIAFVLPPLFNILIHRKVNPYDKWNTRTFAHITLLCFGLFVVAWTTEMNVHDIVKKYQNGNIHGIYSTASDSGSC
jgi:proton-coupled amino acid transporter